MNELILMVQRWPGRRATLAELEAKGYRLSLRFMDILVDEHGCNRKRLELFYNELANEYVKGCGRVSSFARRFPDGVHYRSAFLDKLYAERKPDAISLLPCTEPLYNGQLDPSIIDLIKREQLSEVALLDSYKAGRIESEKELRSIFDASATAKGFARDQSYYIKKIGTETVLRCLHLPSDRAWSYEIRLQLSIADSKRSFNLLPAFVIDPGYRYYDLHYGDRALAKLGIQANMELLNIIGDQLVKER